MKKPRLLRIGLWVGLCLAFLVAGLWSYHALRIASEIAGGVPPRPSLDGRPPELKARIEEAEKGVLEKRRVEMLGELAGVYHANGYHDEAQHCYRALEQADSGNPLWPYRNGILIAGTGDLAPAAERFRAVVKLAPGYLPVRVRLGEIYLKSGDIAAASGEYEGVLARSPAHPYAVLGLARCAIEDGDWHRARRLLEPLVAATEYRLGYDLIVTVYEKVGLPEKAQEVRARSKFSGAFRDIEDPWIEELSADCYDAFQLSLAAGRAKERGFPEEARRLLERAVRFSEDDATLRFQLAIVLMDLSEFARAREQLEQCTRLAPEFADGWAHLTGLLSRLGDEAGAQHVFQQGLSNCPNSPGLHRMRALQLVEKGRLEEAVAFFQRSIELRPTEADAYIQLAITLIKLRRDSEGVDVLLGALKAEPSHPVALTSLAFAAIARGDKSGAVEWLSQAERQPRVDRNELARLKAQFAKTFGSAP